MCNVHIGISDNLVASGAANGAIILWDLNKPGRRKIGLCQLYDIG